MTQETWSHVFEANNSSNWLSFGHPCLTMLVWLLSRKGIVSTLGLCVRFRLNVIQGSRKVVIIFWKISLYWKHRVHWWSSNPYTKLTLQKVNHCLVQVGWIWTYFNNYWLKCTMQRIQKKNIYITFFVCSL